MGRCAIQLALFSQALGSAVSFKLRQTSSSSLSIVGGREVANSDYYYYALPTLPTNTSDDEWLGCGASVISPNFAMSSAHCFGVGGEDPCSGPHNLSIFLGDMYMDPHSYKISKRSNGYKFAKVKAELICHPYFSGKCSEGHDIALLRLLEALPDWVVPVNVSFAPLEEGTVVTSMGYGLTERDGDASLISHDYSDMLRAVNVSVLSETKPNCQRVFDHGWGCSDKASLGPALNKDQQFCAGSSSAAVLVDSCAGDSGGPVLDAATGMQVGIVSYGGGPGEDTYEGPERMCSSPDYAGIYVRMSAFRDWLQNFTAA